MVMPPGIFKSYDIRGIYPQELNEENIIQITKAIYKVFQEKTGRTDILTIALGQDMRLSSPTLFKAVSNTLIDIGARVVDLGLVSTPTLYFATFHYQYDAGIQISASHNPKEYNGLKIVVRGQNGLIKIGKNTGMEDIKNYALQGISLSTNSKGSIIKKEDVLKDEVNNALKISGYPQIKKFKIVADPANAMGGSYINALFEVVDADLVKMNFDLDGSFPIHQPDPLIHENLEYLQRKVLAENADFGMAPDGDGDRLFFVDEKANVVPASIITALVAKELLKKEENKGQKILFDIRYVITPKKVIEEFGGISVITKVGHAFITERLNEVGGLFAGESSGHYFFRDTGNAESQLPIILMVLKVLTEENKKLSEIVEEFRRSYESGEINFKVNNSKEITEALKIKYKDGELSELDGIAIDYPDWRFSVRSSNTEPLLRLNIEALDKPLVEEKKNELVNLINTLAKNS